MTSWGTQFSTGDQGSKEEFYITGMCICQRCMKKDIKKDVQPAGCRMNGDAYGTEVFTCNSCGWTTSFQYDDASNPYYYEAKFYEVHNPKPVIPPQEMTEELRKKFLRILKLVGNGWNLRTAMQQDGISEAEIDEFLASHT